jgi:hypothetical protein
MTPSGIDAGRVAANKAAPSASPQSRWRRTAIPVSVKAAAVPWARHGAGHTLGFDQTVAWLATVCSKSAVTDLMRIA